MENILSNFVQFFYEKHPYLSAQQVKFKEDSGQVCAIVKGLGVTCAVESNGRVIGFDVLDMGEQGKLLLTKQNFDNIMASSSNFARPSKQKKINPRMEIPIPRGVMWLTKAAMYVAEVEKNGNFYNVEVYESTDNEGEKLIDKAEFVSPDELALLAEKYGLKLPDDVLENGGTVSSAEPVDVAIDEEEAQVKESAFTLGVHTLYRLSTEPPLYTPPVARLEKKAATLIDGTKRTIIFDAPSNIVTDKIITLSKQAQAFSVPIGYSINNVSDGDFILITSELASFEPIYVKEASAHSLTGIDVNGKVHHLSLFRSNKPGKITKISQDNYLLTGDWSIYKIASTISTTKESIGNFTITVVNQSPKLYNIKWEDGRDVTIPEANLGRYLAKYGIPDALAAAITGKLGDSTSVNISLYKEDKHQSDTDDTLTSISALKAKIKKVASAMYGTMSAAPEIKQLNDSYQLILAMMQQAQDEQTYTILQQAAMALDALLRYLVPQMQMNQYSDSESAKA